MKHSKISDYKIKKILRCFCEDLDATKTAKLLWVSTSRFLKTQGFFVEKPIKMLITFF